jgi:hypothetical protein
MSESENNFEALRHLLALKRHETPPPGYFNDFSNQVLRRIRAGEGAESTGLMGNLFSQAPWLEKLFQVFNTKPVFASGFAGAICLLLFFGIVYAGRPDLTPQAELSAPAADTTSLAALSPVSLSPSSESLGIVSSTNPVLSLQAVASTSAFGQQNPLAQPVGFTIPGN